MLKKDIIFGSVVLLLAALFALTGCSQATDSDGGTVYSENHLFGTADWQDVARAVASAKQSGRSVVLTDQLVIIGNPNVAATTPTVADFGDLPVRVEGSVTVNGGDPVIVNAAYANLSFAEDARITVEAGGVFIYNGDGDHIYTDPLAPGFKVKFMNNPLEATQGTDARIAVPNYQLGPDFSNVAVHVEALYVLDTLTVDASSDAPGNIAGTPSVIPLGKVDLKENNSRAFVSLTNFRFTADSVLTSSAPGSVTIGLPATAVLPTVKATIPITIAPEAGTITAFTISKIEGPDTVTINGANTTVDLTINNVAADGKVDVRTPAITGDLTIGSVPGDNNAGSISVTAPTFGGAVTIVNNTGPIDINTDDFAGGLAIPAPGRNSGTITINAPEISDAIAVDINAGTISLNASTSVTGGVTVGANSGAIEIETPEIDTAEIAVTANTGEIKFKQDLTLGSVANLIKVPANNGVITFMGSLTTDGTTGDFGSITPANSIAGNGKVVFGGLVNFQDDAILGCDAEFNGGLTRSNNTTLTLGGNVTLGYERAITLAGATPLTLGANKRILVGANPVLAAGNAPVGIAAAGAVLRAGRELPNENLGDIPETFVGNKALTVGTAPITGITGNLRVLGVLNLNVANALTVGTGSLTLEDGGILAFAEAALGGGFTATLGGTVISGINDAESRLTASGGPVTLAANSISGNGSTLAVVPEMGTPAFAVATTTTLTIRGANLALLESGSLTIASGASGGVVLSYGENPGKITLGEIDVGAVPVSVAGKLFTSFGTGTFADVRLNTGDGIVRGDSEEFPIAITDLSGTPASSLTIPADAINPVRIAAGSTIAD